MTNEPEVPEDLTAAEEDAVVASPAAEETSEESASPGGARSRLLQRLRAVHWSAVAKWAGIAVAACWLMAVFAIVLLKWVDPPTTAVQVERGIQASFSSKPYHKQYEFVPLARISPNLQHAVIAAEDARFYQHHGFDWRAMEVAADNDIEGGRVRGGSTITQQLVKNLFFGTQRSLLRKAAEATLVPVAEFVLGKQRILELYLNVVEWGPGVYGAEAASRNWYHADARNVGRAQAAQLAAILPSPRRRKPERMTKYSGIILTRMEQMGW